MLQAARGGATRRYATTAPPKGRATPSMCRHCGSLPRCARCSSLSLLIRRPLRAGEVFGQFCASCHGGVKWTKSEIYHRDNPAAVAQNGAPTDPGVMATANEFKSFTCVGPGGTSPFNYLEKVGTFDPNDPIEIRDNAAAAIALGADRKHSRSKDFSVDRLSGWINIHLPTPRFSIRNTISGPRKPHLCWPAKASLSSISP